MTQHPYADLPPRAFWRQGVAESRGPVPAGIYRRKWPLRRKTRIATAGSCFAQHIGRNLRARGFTVLDLEPPHAHLPADRRADFGYGIYSARYGNVYTVRQMLQLAEEALGIIPQRNIIWEKDGRHYDGLRPTIEPEGLPDPATVIAHRTRHLERVRAMIAQMDVLVFTMGLTEAWLDRVEGTVFPVCPGTVTDDFDPGRHVFHNFTFTEVRDDFLALRALLAEARSGARPEAHPAGHDLKFLITVSPVPLTATAADAHVQVATVHSKSVLRAVAGELAATCPDIDYFPSYEIVTSPWSGHRFYAPNQRSVTVEGVARVMDTFMTAHGVAPAADAVGKAAAPAAGTAAAEGGADAGGADAGGTDGGAMPADPRPPAEEDPAMQLKCDEELLAAFGTRAP